MRFVFITEGRLFLQEDGRDAVEIESPFAREAVDRAAARNERHAWKNADRDDAGSPFSSRVVWGRQSAAAPDGAPAFRHVARGPQPGELLYTLEMSASSGLFRYQLDSREEWRLFHRQDFDSGGLSADPASGQVIVSSRNREDLGKLELMDATTRRRDTITSGDGHDTQPTHHPAQPGIVYFQSAGVGRDEQGRIVDFAPSTLCRLNLTTGELETVLEDAQWDYLAPRIAADGALYYIRRPHHERHHVSFGTKLKHFLLVPWHLATAVFGFLDAFTRLFGKQTLKPTGGPDVPPQRPRFATFQGLPVQLEKVLNAKDADHAGIQLVPGSWELIRQAPSGEAEVIAGHVVAFDLGPKGEVIYSDGLRVWADGEPRTLLHSGHIVQSVVIV